MKSIFIEKLFFFFTEDLVADVHQNLCKKRALSSGEPCSCEYITLFQSLHRGT